MKQNLAQSYKNSSVQTATPGQLVLMLYDGALKFMSQAEAGFSLKNPREFNETINNNIIRAQNILSELQSSLDMKVGGDFPRTMFRLYDFMIHQLQEANIKKKPDPIKVVYGMLKDIRDAWEEMLKKTASETAAAQVGAASVKEDDSQDESRDSDSKSGGVLDASA